MGTSRPAAGPKNPAWTSAKAAATSLANGRPGATPRKVVRRAAQALGGGVGGGAWSPGSRRVAQRLAGLLAGAADGGLIESARNIGIGDLDGMPAGDAIMAMLNWVTDGASDLDEQAARRSVEAVLADFVSGGGDLEEALDPDTGRALLKGFVVQHLIRSILTPLTPRFAENVPAQQSREYEQQLSRTVEALLDNTVYPEKFSTVNWVGPEGAAILDLIRKDALDILAEEDS